MAARAAIATPVEIDRQRISPKRLFGEVLSGEHMAYLRGLASER
jgi:hypothetical protein